MLVDRQIFTHLTSLYEAAQENELYGLVNRLLEQHYLQELEKKIKPSEISRGLLRDKLRDLTELIALIKYRGKFVPSIFQRSQVNQYLSDLG